MTGRTPPEWIGATPDTPIPPRAALDAAVALYNSGLSLRAVMARTGVNREVLRKHMRGVGAQRRPRIYAETEAPIDRFMANVWPEPMSGCWLYASGKHEFGYGFFSSGGKRDVAHRWSWRLHKGEIPAGKYVCHKCDVPACVNPDHLFLGSQKENMQDAVNKGRARAPVKFTDDVVKAVMAARAAGVRPRDIEQMYGASYKHQYQFRKRASRHAKAD